MSRIAKLIEQVRTSRKDVRLADACKIAEKLGFEHKATKGSHHVFARTGELMQLNFQERSSGCVPAYQIDQLVLMIEKYWGNQEDGDE